MPKYKDSPEVIKRAFSQGNVNPKVWHFQSESVGSKNKCVILFGYMDRIAFMHIRQATLIEDGAFEESGHISSCGSLDMYEIVKVLVKTGFDDYVRLDHGRMIQVETGKPGYGLCDRALGATYINGLFEACEKGLK